MKRGTTSKTKNAYSLEEVRAITDRHIDASAERLRKRLREAWKKQEKIAGRNPYGVAI